MMQLKKNQKGITLIELMIAILIGLIVLSATIGIFVTSLKSNSDTLKMIRLNQELQAVMTLMTRDIRRSGYWGVTTTGTVNAYATTAWDNVVTNECLVLAYDVDNDGTTSGNDYVAYQWVDDRIEMSISTALPTCGDDWPDVTDPAVVNISQPILSLNRYAAGDNFIYVLTLELTGNLVDDSFVSRTLKETIRLRNDVIN